MPERYSLVNAVTYRFAELDNSFQILEECFLKFCAFHNVTFTDTTGF